MKSVTLSGWNTGLKTQMTLQCLSVSTVRAKLLLSHMNTSGFSARDVDKGGAPTCMKRMTLLMTAHAATGKCSQKDTNASHFFAKSVIGRGVTTGILQAMMTVCLSVRAAVH